ncbi:hypothetical protein FO519_008278 [Halicephalobus sp. NKZ332]|nr:hypothetical protein FO519_008278 [Halicephalobus sp. NKZ332]
MAPRGHGRKTAPSVSRPSVLPQTAAVKLAIEAPNPWEDRLRKRPAKNTPEEMLTKVKVNPKRPRKSDRDGPSASRTPLGLLDLPNEVLARVLHYTSLDDLFNIERVCRRFNLLTKGYVWRQIHTLDHEMVIRSTYNDNNNNSNSMSCVASLDAFAVKHHLTDRSVKMVLSRTNITDLDLSRYFLTITYKVVNCFSFASNLNVLNLSRIRLTNTSLRTIGRYCPLIEYLTLEQCFCDASVEKGLEVLFSKCRNIKYLNLAENMKLTGDSFQSIPEGVSYLDLAGCYNVPVRNMDVLSDRLRDSLRTLILENYENASVNQMNRWLQVLTKLEHLELSNWFVTFDGSHLNFSHLKDLKVLKMNYNFVLTSQGLQTLRFCPKLQVLDVSYCMKMEGDMLGILRNIPTLEACNFDGTSELGDEIIEFVNEMKLKSLSISDCSGLTGDTVLKMLMECKSLHRVNIRKMTISQSAVITLDALRCPELRQRMEISRCEINVIINGMNYCLCPVADPCYFVTRRTPKQLMSQ